MTVEYYFWAGCAVGSGLTLIVIGLMILLEAHG